jgi:NAD(P)-dependent dehydrogenase (short-subunit alcohol dehydrogenase family)
MGIQSKVWYVTGASEGLGLNLVKQLLAGGYKVAAASEDLDGLEDAIGTASAHFLPLQVHLSSEESVIASLQLAVDTFGKIDVVVNHAEEQLKGDFAEMSDKQARACFEINVFGMMNVIRNVMTYFRKQQSGHIFNISSLAGLVGNYAGMSIYTATKFAVAGLSQSLAAEARPFGIHVTVVLPDQFRTGIDHPVKEKTGGWQEQKTIVGQMAEQETVAVRQVGKETLTTQQTNPQDFGASLISSTMLENPPLYLFLHENAYQFANDKIDYLKNKMCLWQNV